MNYEFHVGDYVETIGGFVGWISDIKDNNYIIIVDENNDNDRCGYYLPQEDRCFVRIGTHSFTKKEKKIKNLPCVTSTIDYGSNSWLIDKLVEARSKINELVDAVNKLMDKEDEE